MPGSEGGIGEQGARQSPQPKAALLCAAVCEQELSLKDWLD